MRGIDRSDRFDSDMDAHSASVRGIARVCVLAQAEGYRNRASKVTRCRVDGGVEW